MSVVSAGHPRLCGLTCLFSADDSTWQAAAARAGLGVVSPEHHRATVLGATVCGRFTA